MEASNEPTMEAALGEYSSKVPLAELVRLGAVDNDIFARTFFPKAARQRAPLFHREMDELLENPAYRMVNLRCFRGSAKTTKLRIFAAKRIAYAISRTILYIGASEAHAARSVRWLRAQIEEKLQADGTKRKPLFGAAFGLKLDKYSDTELQIIQELPGEPPRTTWVLGVGITGNIRGINFEDYRPDLIILDDVITDENAATHEQRDKITDLLLGAVSKSLAPETEEPNAKLAILQTPIHPQDVSALAAKASSFKTATFGCWTEGTKSFPVDMQQSIWEERYPTGTLRAEKRAAVELNKLSIFQREMECNITSPEQCPFKAEWLKYRPVGEFPVGGLAILSIDPVPPPSERSLKRALKGKDFEAQTVWRRHQGNYHLVECVTNRGHEPSWSVTKALELAYRHRVSRIILQSIAYERTLKWLLETEMARRGVYYMIIDTSGKSNQQNKHSRIIGALQGPASHGKIWVDASQMDFITQFTEYKLGIDHDDILDASAIGLMDLINPHLELGQDEYYSTDDMPVMKMVRNCP